MQYNQILQNCFDDQIGSCGVSFSEYNRLLAKTSDILTNIKSKNWDLLKVVTDFDEINEIKKTAHNIRENFSSLIVLGTGGSMLNPKALCALQKNDFEIHFIDTVDPDSINNFIENIDLSEAALLIISKSGKTLEVFAQSFAFFNAFDGSDIDKKGRVFVISDPIDNPLRDLAKDIGAVVLDHNPNIGGRFATFTNVGLLPAAVVGVDIEKLCEGAALVVENAMQKLSDSDVAKAAAFGIAAIESGKNIHVMIPYADRLNSMTMLHRQIWAESIGKNGNGSTLVDAIGPIDHHSQFQLYLDGPKDKIFTIISVENQEKSAKFNIDDAEKYGVGYLSGKSTSDVMEALNKAAVQTMINNNIPMRIIDIPRIDELSVGGLIMQFSFETIIAAQLLEINAFDQPAVEDCKIIARKILKNS